MDKASDPVIVRHDPAGRDDMEQVRQLIIGDHAERQAQQIENLERRVAKLEQLLRAIVSHSESSQRTWQVEVATLLNEPADRSAGPRGVSRDVTPLSPGRNDND